MDPRVAGDPTIVAPEASPTRPARWPELLDHFLPALRFRLDLRRAFADEEARSQ
jgi:hypothetical protein